MLCLEAHHSLNILSWIKINANLLIMRVHLFHEVEYSGVSLWKELRTTMFIILNDITMARCIYWTSMHEPRPFALFQKPLSLSKESVIGYQICIMKVHYIYRIVLHIFSWILYQRNRKLRILINVFFPRYSFDIIYNSIWSCTNVKRYGI